MPRLSKEEKRKFCIGCHDNFYNGNNPYDIKWCWNLAEAKVVTRFRIGWWTPMDRKENFTKVTTLDCHKEPGQFAFCEKLPQHLVNANTKG